MANSLYQTTNGRGLSISGSLAVIFSNLVYIFFPLSDLCLLSYLTTGIGQDEREKLYEGEIM